MINKKRWSDPKSEMILNYLMETKLNNKEIKKPSASIYYHKQINKF